MKGLSQRIVIEKLPPMLNEWQRLHHMERRRIKQDWAWLIRAENPKRHKGAVVVTYTRVSTSEGDPDNVAASFKVIGDALVGAGVIEDDSFSVIREFRVRWRRAKSLKDQKTIIEIEDYLT